ncbi:hypothetical protein J1605_022795 [Eschrichtius robustus]|uniref:Uncharacterized protein n=1 Tax=Eschrichtius robustus TaxID=9764 RepID=A0AB34H7U5_ESCRO|nr:hypothetical protein J1605_022795 [Eschrichtius robustus]
MAHAHIHLNLKAAEEKLLVWDLPLYSSTGNVLTALFTPVDKPITLASLCEVAELTTLTGSNQSGMAFSKQKTRFSHTNHLCTGSSTGLRLQSASTSTLSPVSLPAKSSPPTAFWTSSPQSPPASPTGGTPSTSVLPDTASARTFPSAKNDSAEPREEEPTSPASNWEGTDADASPTSGGVHLTPTLEEHTSDTPEARVPATGSQPPVESPALTSPQAPASSPSPPSTSPPEEVPSASVSTNRNSAEASTKPTGALTTSEPPAEEHSSGHRATSHAPAEPVPTETTAQATVPPRVTCMLIDTETTTASPGVIMQEVEHELSSGESLARARGLDDTEVLRMPFS